MLQYRLNKGDELIQWLMDRGRAHAKVLETTMDDKVLREAAVQLVRDRDAAHARGLSAPGQAEYLDLVRALIEEASGTDEQLALLEEISRFVFEKHPDPEEDRR